MTFMHRVSGHIAALLVVLGAAAGAAETPESPDAIEALIWEREMAIFEGRSAGDISNYLNATSADLLLCRDSHGDQRVLSRLASGFCRAASPG